MRGQPEVWRARRSSARVPRQLAAQAEPARAGRQPARARFEGLLAGEQSPGEGWRAGGPGDD